MVNQCTSAETMKEGNVIIDNYQYLFLFRSQYIYCAPKTVCESFSFSTFCNLHELAINVRGQCYSSQYKCFLLKIGICNLIGCYDGICIFWKIDSFVINARQIYIERRIRLNPEITRVACTLGVRVMVFNATLNNIAVISWQSVLWVGCRKSLTNFITYYYMTVI